MSEKKTVFYRCICIRNKEGLVDPQLVFHGIYQGSEPYEAAGMLFVQVRLTDQNREVIPGTPELERPAHLFERIDDNPNTYEWATAWLRRGKSVDDSFRIVSLKEPAEGFSAGSYFLASTKHGLLAPIKMSKTNGKFYYTGPPLVRIPVDKLLLVNHTASFDRLGVEHPNSKPYDLNQGYPMGEANSSGKDRWDLMPWQPLTHVAKVMTYESSRDKPGGWMNVAHPRARYTSEMVGHMVAWFNGQEDDPESKLPHLAHAICCALFLLHFSRKG